jgi:hypothetical protein
VIFLNAFDSFAVDFGRTRGGFRFGSEAIVSRRGGFRRRYVTPGSVPVWISSGRWGPRRARVEQCVTLAAELVYHQMVCEGPPFGAGSRATLTWTPNGSSKSWPIGAEVVANAVWRRGRLFFRCPACQRRAARLCVPVADLEPRCRRCWGLSYESRSWSYKPTGFLKFLGPIAYVTTQHRREHRREAAQERYRQRRAFLVR